MKKVYKILLVITTLIVVSLVSFVIILGITFGSNDLCGNNITETNFSPNGKYKVVVFQRNCGATTDFSFQVSILKDKENLKNDGGNIFIIDNNDIKVFWINDKEINIGYKNNSEIFKIEEKFQKIKINYNLLN